ncbi:MAG: UDP-N-acetylglucosamine 2-epimerase (non-hydrolyzing) [Campylobacteraceae bacterium]|jgi:UDP-N-acetylglucosamine 2-epimerase (non-hydrolysing)|nr:UDP-N-acetylglucosamine 2-epimerase (non-hydrolyzing) [Campylobacteraceae bacterium]
MIDGRYNLKFIMAKILKMKQKTILFVFGTRPEVIKLAPLILYLRKYDRYNAIVCNTEQQKEMSNQTLTFFDIKSDINLDIMTADQQLSNLQSNLLNKLSNIVMKNTYDAIIVQGDTMSAFCGALTGFYSKIPVFHIEAGLRSYNLFEPFPEEALRQMISRIASLHFAPTIQAKNALLNECIREDAIVVSGNTVIDALYCLSETTLSKSIECLKKNGVKINDKLVLITVHRRENHGDRLNTILEAISVIAGKFPDHQFVLPVHPNPNVKHAVQSALGSFHNIKLLQPLDYPDLVVIMKHAKLILTDSGGIQEEAPTFGVPILVMRYETERKEGIEVGFAKLVGADYKKIVDETSSVLEKNKFATKKNIANPYGDGNACRTIEKAIKKLL